MNEENDDKEFKILKEKMKMMKLLTGKGKPYPKPSLTKNHNENIKQKVIKQKPKEQEIKSSVHMITETLPNLNSSRLRKKVEEITRQRIVYNNIDKSESIENETRKNIKKQEEMKPELKSKNSYTKLEIEFKPKSRDEKINTNKTSNKNKHEETIVKQINPIEKINLEQSKETKIIRQISKENKRVASATRKETIEINKKYETKTNNELHEPTKKDLKRLNINYKTELKDQNKKNISSYLEEHPVSPVPLTRGQEFDNFQEKSINCIDTQKIERTHSKLKDNNKTMFKKKITLNFIAIVVVQTFLHWILKPITNLAKKVKPEITKKNIWKSQNRMHYNKVKVNYIRLKKHSTYPMPTNLPQIKKFTSQWKFWKFKTKRLSSPKNQSRKEQTKTYCHEANSHSKMLESGRESKINKQRKIFKFTQPLLNPKKGKREHPKFKKKSNNQYQ